MKVSDPMKAFALPALLLLVACGTPQEQCINGATRDMRVVDRLIAESEQTLARGYTYVEVTTFRTGFVDCTQRPTAENPKPEVGRCLGEIPETIRKPVAVDLNAEAAKLASLKAKRTQQAQQAGAAIRQCKALHPA